MGAEGSTFHSKGECGESNFISGAGGPGRKGPCPKGKGNYFALWTVDGCLFSGQRDPRLGKMRARSLKRRCPVFAPWGAGPKDSISASAQGLASSDPAPGPYLQASAPMCGLQSAQLRLERSASCAPAAAGLCLASPSDSPGSWAPPSRAEGALPMAALPSGLPPVLRRRPNPQPALRPRRAGGKRGLSPRTLVASGLHGPGARLRSRSRLGKDGQRRPRLQSVVRSTRARAGHGGLGDGRGPVHMLGGAGWGAQPSGE